MAGRKPKRPTVHITEVEIFVNGKRVTREELKQIDFPGNPILDSIIMDSRRRLLAEAIRQQKEREESIEATAS